LKSYKNGETSIFGHFIFLGVVNMWVLILKNIL